MKKTKYSKKNITDFINKKYNADIVLFPVKEGMESQVYEYCYNGLNYILRINQTDYGFKKDDYAYKNFNSKKIPIPKIIEYGKFYDDYYCISKKSLGITYEDSSYSTITELVSNVHELFVAISSIDISNTTGYGKLDYKTKNAPFNSWKDFLANILNYENWYIVKKECNLLNIELDEIFEQFKYLLKYVPETRKLYHGDFSNNNLIVNEQKTGFSGVIDWDCSGYGDPLQTIAGANFWSSHLYCAMEFAKYCNPIYKNTINYIEIIKFYELYIVLDEIYENTLDGNIKMVKWCFLRAKEIINGKVLVLNSDIFEDTLTDFIEKS